MRGAQSGRSASDPEWRACPAPIIMFTAPFRAVAEVLRMPRLRIEGLNPAPHGLDLEERAVANP